MIYYRQRWQASTALLRLLSQATILCPFCFAKDGLIGSYPFFQLKTKTKRTGIYPIRFVLAAVAASDGATLLPRRFATIFMSVSLCLRQTARHGRKRFESCNLLLKQRTEQTLCPLFWQPRQDSNLRMQQSKCCVLPLDDSAMFP